MSKRKSKSPSPPSPKWKKVRLNSPDHLRRLLTKCINMLMANEIKEEKLRAVSYASQILFRIFEISQIEKRFTEIEGKIDEIHAQNKKT